MIKKLKKILNDMKVVSFSTGGMYSFIIEVKRPKGRKVKKYEIYLVTKDRTKKYFFSNTSDIDLFRYTDNLAGAVIQNIYQTLVTNEDADNYYYELNLECKNGKVVNACWVMDEDDNFLDENLEFIIEEIK